MRLDGPVDDIVSDATDQGSAVPSTVPPAVDEWLAHTLHALRRARTSKAELVEMMLWEQMGASPEDVQGRLDHFRLRTGRR